ncbi:hypothetical protein L0Z31_28045 [Burkholderia vietnamiensis]|uniref:hypothetical protein n=1 Tax=Burkholderia vietnamiensis TaxID=60552 RepID=UPI002019C583|nr:hypothetical protein [Burkholderia vietnamiensis]MCO1351030.1 hypothetical protein [Burkholderia vietnamiensis]MCO1433767.1 hypothetical protein [Burkholderia vietnamiensis]UQN48407.1 hypothetical protein L0Y95_18285 [Burkholderia vietnamiensis]
MNYNSLHVPLAIGTWQCALVPVSAFYQDWSYRERRSPFADRDTREQMERQIADDLQIFNRYFRPKYDLRSITGAAALRNIRDYVADRLNVAHWNLPTDNEGIERMLKKVVAEGKLVPIVNREWHALPMTFRPTPAPLRWPASVNSPAAQVVPYGGGTSASVGGGPSLGIAEKLASVADDGDGGFDWLGVAETMVGDVLGNSSDDPNDKGLLARSLADDASSTPLGDAPSFEYADGLPDADAEQIAGMPFNGTPGSWASSMPGSMRQLRQYGPNGTPMTDIDFEAHHGNSNPHAHNWDGTTRDEGAPVSILPW